MINLKRKKKRSVSCACSKKKKKKNRFLVSIFKKEKLKASFILLRTYKFTQR